MYRIRFINTSSLRVDFTAGDELTISKLTAEVRQLLKARRIDGAAVCELVEGRVDEVHEPTAEHEHAAVRSSRRR